VIAKVEPLTPARALRGPFDYRLPGEMADVDVGSMLVIPFGQRRLLGVVVELAQESDVPPERLVEPLKALESGVPAELVSLGLWVAEEYCSTPARGLSLVLPPGAGTGANRSVGPRRALFAELTDAGRAAVADESSAPGRLGGRQRAALAALTGGPLSVAGLTRATGAGHTTVRALESRGLVSIERTELKSRPDMGGVGARAVGGAPLTAAQGAALAGIVERMDAAPGDSSFDRRVLLHGVTGSGKTEVYLQAAAACLERGRSAIVLVPEIALTPQTAARFEQRFGDAVAVLHSKLGAAERRDEWLRLRRGEARVCVGPRSAVFAPVADLGLIVIDEEHDASYKQEGDPRYDARHVAERRAGAAGAVLLAGTATPRPESWARLTRLTMPERVDSLALPPVQVVGTAGMTGPLHPRTRDALEVVRERGEKAIVLLNRRGWSNFLSCRSCGRAWECPDCDVTLVLHRAAGRVSCHHCGHSQRVPSTCPDCGSVSVARHGAGTERLEEDLAQLVDPLPVFRLDADAAAGRGAILDVLRRFDQASSGVLVGTQMVAKGHDFPDVTLGVVIDADSTLRFPDFRAEERTFALVAQLAGRSGRGSRGGRVIVQALDTGARSLRHAAAHDAEGFLTGEIARREALRYPPFASLIRVVCSAREPGPEAAAAAAVAERLAPAGLSVLGPAPLFRLKGRERAQMIVKAPAGDRAAAVRAVRRAVEAVSSDKAHRGAAYSVDVDPQ
jgi:primosomal protein N' (replication factor Y) (superfamily II helicase)